MNQLTKKHCIVLLSGGLDSATVLSIARKDFEVTALTFDYGQRHKFELTAAQEIAKKNKITLNEIKIDLAQFGNSALTDNISVPKNQEIGKEIPVTYVPVRNTIFLSYALAFAEVNQIFDIFIGVNALDYSGYPDCRPEFIDFI
jgi:7-cyano-7-deazaguanine synthase